MTKLLLLLSAALMAVNLLSHSASAKDLLDTDELDKADINGDASLWQDKKRAGAWNSGFGKRAGAWNSG
uniref:Secreted protein n=2 Tax=Macrostomum lignano TaxID=282301 RepID=A0A1I8HFI7_9PLAT